MNIYAAWLILMNGRETSQIHKYGESKTTRIMMVTVCHVTAWAGRTKYQADGLKKKQLQETVHSTLLLGCF